MIEKDAILAALGRLDPANDEHWTAQGLPAIKAVEELAGGSGLTRAAVDEAAPGFTRTVAAAANGASGQDEKPEAPPAPPVPPAPEVSAAPEPSPPGPAQPSPEQVAAALNSLDPAVLREALKQVPAEHLKEPPPPPEPVMEPVSLSEANRQTLALDTERQERERQVKRLVKDALKTGA